MQRNKQTQHVLVRVNNVIWLKEAARSTPRPGAPPLPAASPAQLRQVLTALAGLDVLEMELLGLCPQGGPVHRHLVEARMAAARSRRALHDANPALSVLEVIEILHVVGTVRGDTPALTPMPKTRDRVRMQFKELEPRWYGRARWGTAALMMVLVSIQCIVAMHGGGPHEWGDRPLMTSLSANVPMTSGNAPQRDDRPRHGEMSRH